MSERRSRPRWERAAWGKLGAGDDPHALVCHAIDTAVVAEHLYDVVLGPEVRAEIEAGLASLGSVEERRAWVAVLCGLHDIGKLSPAFQALRIDRASELLGESAVRAMEAVRPDERLKRWDTAHALISAVHMDCWLRDREAPWPVRARLVELIGGHHGLIPDPDMIKQAGNSRRQVGEKEWAAAREALLDELVRLWGLDPRDRRWAETDLSVGAAVGIAGLTVLSDWTASARPLKEYASDVEDLAGYRTREIERVDGLMDRLNWRPWRPRETSFAALFPEEPRPRPLQQQVQELLAGVERPGVLVIEAPTGEGKTKAGLQACTTLVQRLGLGGVYVAVPTRALADPLHREVNKMLGAIGSPLRANLLYTGAAANLERRVREGEESGEEGLDVFARFRPYDVARDCGDAEAHRAAARTFTRKRALTFPVGVGTIDQALMAAERTRYVTMRLASLAGKVLMIDEVHAHDAYMSVLLDRLLWWCGRLGVPVVLLSATLPARRREQLIASWRSGATGEAPRPEAVKKNEWQLTWVEAGERGPSRPIRLSDDNPARRVAVERIADDPVAIAGKVVALLRDGGCAAVIRNTKPSAKRCRDEIAALLKEMDSPPELLYLDGKMDPDKRRQAEQKLAELCGRESSGVRNAIIVGTQVLEHGIDADFDVVVTDPCPIDLLVQRAGRLHRHKRGERPAAVADPRLLVVQAKEPMKFPAHTTSIYAKNHLLATEHELAENDVISLPHDIPQLVHNVYVDENRIPEGSLRKHWKAARKKRSDREKNNRFEGGSQLIPMLREGSRLVGLTQRPVGSQTRKKDGRKRDGK
ncbi:CRISPR-associated helicase Cas3' [Spirillospora sp. NPDC127200]